MTLFLLILAVMCAAFAGCAKLDALAEGLETAGGGEKTPAPTSGGEESATPDPTEEPRAGQDKFGITLAKIKQAAQDAGYIVSDGHQFILMDGIVDGITIQIVADGADTLYSIAECESEETAQKNAKEIDDMGYAISLRNGRFFTCFDAERQGSERKNILMSILMGKPRPAPPYSAQQPTQAPKNPDLAGIPAYDPGDIPDDGMQQGKGYVSYRGWYVKITGMEKKLFADQPGIVLAYELTNLSDESIDTQSLYVEVLQNGKELRHPATFEPAYLAVKELAPQETLTFRDEYLLDNETDPVEAKIREFLVLVSDPPWVYQTFPLT